MRHVESKRGGSRNGEVYRVAAIECHGMSTPLFDMPVVSV
jgi:hypothetical protein